MIYKPLSQVLKDIKSLKIQGAEAVSREAVKSLKPIIHKSKAKTAKDILSELRKAAKKLSETRPTEPFMRNSLKYVFAGLDAGDLRSLKEEALSRIQKALFIMDHSRKAITEIGSQRIKKGMVVFVHFTSRVI